MRNEKVEGKRESHGGRGLLFPGRAGASSFLIPLVLGFGIFTACSSSPDACDYGGCLDGGADGVAVDGQSGDGSVDAKPDVDPPPPGCDTPNEPLKNPEKCLVDSFGAFVSPAGDDANPGTKAKPFKTIGAALGTKRLRIVACEGNYNESVDVTANAEIYSGIACTFDKAGGRAKLQAAKPEYAMKVAKVSLILSELDIEAQPGTAGAVNSVALWLVESTSVKVRGGTIAAKEGFKGESGASGATGVYAVGNGNGNAADTNNSGAGKSCACSSGGTSFGGAGGASSGSGQNGADNIPATAGNDGAGGVGPVSCSAAEPNGTGNNGSDRVDAANAQKVTVLGQLDGTAGWSATQGTNAGAGLPGQGGGGGASRGAMSFGGGGACGGCGGTGGKGGKGGGASIAMLSYQSTVTLEKVALVTGAGGAGGAGGDGGAGAAGGGSLSGCSGGDGGRGGKGGAGSGGAGGISVPVLYKGTKPGGDATYTFGTPGAGGTGGAAGVNDGPIGVAQNELEAP